MIVAFISDPHSHAEKCEAAINDARENGAGKIVCLGDVVGYGEEPGQTIKLVRDNCSECVMGNHDAAVSGKCSTWNFNPRAKRGVDRNRGQLSETDIAWLRELPYVVETPNYACAHGEFSLPHRFEYVFDIFDSLRSFRTMTQQILLVGHTHNPCAFDFPPKGMPTALSILKPVEIRSDHRYMFNPGSVGEPRNYALPYPSYILFDDSKMTVNFRILRGE